MSQVDTPKYPRITIEYCTQCRWMLRAAYFAQELLTTFSTAIGEVALLPSTGGRFVVSVVRLSESERDTKKRLDGFQVQGSLATNTSFTVWDRNVEEGFPETKVLKQRIRDIISPEMELGHSDKSRDLAVPG